MSAPKFVVQKTPRGELVICTYEGHQGAARVFSKGLIEAKQRAEEQARKKAAESGAA